MSELCQRVLLWHKLIAMQTGGIALCSTKHRLNRDEAKGWADALQNVVDDINQFLTDGTFLLDDRGNRIVGSGHREGTGRTLGPGSDGDGRPARPAAGRLVRQQEARHEEVAKIDQSPVKSSAATGPNKVSGRRIATRKKP